MAPKRDTPPSDMPEHPRPMSAAHRRRVSGWQDRTPLPGQLAIDGTVVGHSDAHDDPAGR